MVYDQCIEQLGQVYGKARLWKDAVTQARNQARRNSRQSTMDKQLEEADALRQLGLFVRNNCYYALGDNEEDPTRISNFILTPLFHIHDEQRDSPVPPDQLLPPVGHHRTEGIGIVFPDELPAKGRLTGQLCVAGQD